MRGSEKLITSNRKISSQFVHECRVLERVRGVGVVEAAAVGAELLDDLLAGHRAAGDGLLAAGQRVDDLVVQVEVLDRAAGDQDDRARSRRSAAGCGCVPRTRSTQKLPSSPVSRAGESAHERDRDRHADRGRDEVLHGQAGHLNQVALGRLTGVRLPVRVRDEADRGVPGERRGHRRGRIVEVQRQLALDQLEDEQEQDADRREGQHAAGVCAPGLFRLRVGPDQPVDATLARASACRSCKPGTCSRRAARARPQARRSASARNRIPAVVVLTQNLSGKSSAATEKQRKKDRQHQADDVFVAHSPSTNFCTRPSTPKINTVSTM